MNVITKVDQNKLLTTLKCPRCDKSNNYKISDNFTRIEFCRSCGATFNRTSDTIKLHDEYIKEFLSVLKKDIPEDTITCRYCGSWFWSVDREGHPTHCGRCNKNYPEFKEEVEVIEEVVTDRFGVPHRTGLSIKKPGQKLTKLEKPTFDIVPELLKARDKFNYRYRDEQPQQTEEKKEIIQEETIGESETDSEEMIEDIGAPVKKKKRSKKK